MDLNTIIFSLLAGVGANILKQLAESDTLWQKIQQYKIIVEILGQIGIHPPKPKETYQERMNRLMTKFDELSLETNVVVSELETNLRQKEAIVRNLETQENELSTRLQTLKSSPEAGNIELQRRLDMLIEEQKRESKKGKWQDFLYFALGVFTPYLITFIGNILKAKGIIH
jgi:hypothetical protein